MSFKIVEFMIFFSCSQKAGSIIKNVEVVVQEFVKLFAKKSARKKTPEIILT